MPRTRLPSLILCPALVFACLACSGVAPATPLPVSFSAGYGPALSLVDGQAQYVGGRTFALDAIFARAGADGLIRAAYLGYDRSTEGGSLLSYNAGQLYVPISGQAFSGALRTLSLEWGLRPGFDAGPVHFFFDGLAGVSRVEVKRLAATFRNDRRPDSALALASTAIDGRWAPSFALDAGVQVFGPARIAFTASMGADWVPIEGALAPLRPVRFAAVWPVDSHAAPEGRAETSRAPELLVTMGTTLLGSPEGLRRGSRASGSLGVGFEVGLGRNVALTLEGEQALENAPSGDLFFSRYPLRFGRQLFTLTSVLGGIKLSALAGSLRPYVRAELGWGRALGDPLISSTQVDSVTLIGLVQSPRRPEEGLAYEAMAGCSLRLGDGVRLFGEAGVFGIRRPYGERPVLAVPLRVGVALR